MFTPVKSDYAYGWIVRKQFNRTMTGHGGGINGFTTFIARYPEQRALVVVLCNQESSPSGRIARDLAAILFGEKYEVPPDRREVAVAASVLDAYTGVYQFSPTATLTITREGDHLIAQISGQEKAPRYAESETKFFSKIVDAEVVFAKDSSGRVTHISFRQGEMERNLPRK